MRELESQVPLAKHGTLGLHEERRRLEARLPYASDDERAKINTRLVHIQLECDNIDRALNALSKYLRSFAAISKPRTNHLP